MKPNVETDDKLPEISASRWGGVWSKNEIQLVFGDDEKVTTLSLNPASVKELRSNVNEWLAAHEAMEGTLWSEDYARCGKQNDLRLFGKTFSELENACADFPTNNFSAKKLYLLLRNLPLDGYEHSFKMLPNKLLSQRFLTGLPLSTIAPEDVMTIADELRMPANLRDKFAAELAHAIYLHAGFEQDMGDSTYKLYLEYPEDSGKPLYIGYKWDTQNGMRHAISHYTKLPSLSLTDMNERIGAAYGNAQAAPAIATSRVLALAALLLTSKQHDPLLFVDVTDQGSPRHSFDINLYNSGLLIHDLQSPLRELARHFDLPDAEFNALMQTIEGDLAGHISGGLDRNGEAFLTVYHARPNQSD